VHVFADFWGCPREQLENASFLEAAVKETAYLVGTDLLKIDSHQFRSPGAGYSRGVTVYAILSESHIAIHTYPEAGFAAIDIYVCGRHCNPRRGLEYLRERLRPTSISFSEMVRGQRPSH